MFYLLLLIITNHYCFKCFVIDHMLDSVTNIYPLFFLFQSIFPRSLQWLAAVSLYQASMPSQPTRTSSGWSSPPSCIHQALLDLQRPPTQPSQGHGGIWVHHLPIPITSDQGSLEQLHTLLVQHAAGTTNM